MITEGILMETTNIGFKQWFQDRVDPAKLIDHQIARVISVNKDSYIIKSEKGETPGEITGKLMFTAESPLDYPTVGDWVYAQYLDQDSFAVIDEILPRKTVLKRKTSGKNIAFQLIAANIDTGLIVQSLDGNYNLRRLERYLVMINESRIQPVVLLSKSDLLSPEEIGNKVDEIHKLMPELRVVPFSNKAPLGLVRVEQLLTPGDTYCLLGSSGVGKTTLLNNLLNQALLETQTVREKDGKGRHTTTRRQLIPLAKGAMIVDTPGMRELGNIAVGSGIEDTFDEIAALAQRCRFKDCSHTKELGCAVLAAVDDGRIAEARYQNYLRLNKESSFHEMSYLEKKRKDKKFGKLIKSVMKNKKNKR